MNEKTRRSQPTHSASRTAHAKKPAKRNKAAAKSQARKRQQRKQMISAIAEVIATALVLVIVIHGNGKAPGQGEQSPSLPAAEQTQAPEPTDIPETAIPEPTDQPTAAPSRKTDLSLCTVGGVLLTDNTASDTLPYQIYVSKKSYTIAILGADENGEYTRLLRTFRTAIGTGNKTRAGSYEIDKKYDWYAWQLGGYTPYTCRFGGSKIRLHAPLHNEDKDWNSLYREGYRQIGSQATQGCLRTTCQGAAWVYYNCDIGTQVVIVNDDLYESEDPPALGDSHSDPTRPLSADDLEIPVTFFALNTESVTLSVGQAADLTLENVLPQCESKRKFVYASGDESVALVDEAGHITAVGEGTTRVLVMADDVNRAYRMVEVTVHAEY